MLIMTRRVGETIIIDDDVEVTIYSLKGNQVKLGVTAPEETTIHREEIYMRLNGDTED